MMRSITTKCVILGHKNFGESDKLIFMYSKDLGKIKTIAKGARKLTSKFTGHLETLNFCIATLYFGPKNIIITEITEDESCPRLPQKLNILKSAIKIAEITNNMLYENQKMEKLEETLKETLNHLITSQKPKLITLSYIIKFLDQLGLLPNFKQTSMSLDLKYRKCLNFIANKPLTLIEKIKLTKIESLKIQKLIKTLLL